ncbi:MAG: diphosphate--fructose-6-phosphate 1-phosphotransferase [Candidatus Limiplasma sp.]|nr:diphosphate--fructose-6-phosphate 1-phosphotransferase [Candidatus Limiplasma sp.]
MSKLLIAHGGAPTAVLNASLYGAVTEAQKHAHIDGIWGAIHGSAGILEERFTDLGALPPEKLALLLTSPASAIGTSRTPLEAPEYARMAQALQKHKIGYVLFAGGNGSMDTCGKLARACQGLGIVVGGIPKTIDNDIGVIDHAPGYGSAARFAAQALREIAQDVKAMPIHVCIVEMMGRNAGWIAAATALARTGEGTAPHLIYLPERPFDEKQFLTDVKRQWDRQPGVVVAVSEGLKRPDGETVAPPVFRSGRARYDGDVSAYLAKLVISELGIKARNEKPGILGRCCLEMQSPVDREEAVRMGALAAKTVLAGQGSMMAGLRRISDDPYRCQEILVPVQEVMLQEHVMPGEFLHPNGHDVTDAFVRWCKPLIGGGLPVFADFKQPIA